jgi:hypothetical protein
MSSENGSKIEFDAADLTLLEHAEAMKAADPYKEHPSAQTFVLAGMVWQLMLRSDPTFTYDQALGLKFSDLEIVGVEVPEVPGASSGAPAPLSAVPGESVPAT